MFAVLLRTLFIYLTLQLITLGHNFDLSAVNEKLEDYNVSHKDIAYIRQQLNQLRNLVANGSITDLPPAENMQELAWDEDFVEEVRQQLQNCSSTAPEESVGLITYGLKLDWKAAMFSMTKQLLDSFEIKRGNPFLSDTMNVFACGVNKCTNGSYLYGCYGLPDCSQEENRRFLKHDFMYRPGMPACDMYDLKQSPVYPNLCRITHLNLLDNYCDYHNQGRQTMSSQKCKKCPKSSDRSCSAGDALQTAVFIIN